MTLDEALFIIYLSITLGVIFYWRDLFKEDK